MSKMKINVTAVFLTATNHQHSITPTSSINEFKQSCVLKHLLNEYSKSTDDKNSEPECRTIADE